MEAHTKRINRVIGQLRGIERMIEEKRDCRDVLQQISAVKKAIDGLSKEIVNETIGKQIGKANAQHVEKLVEQVMGM
jgi:CsoR family transcriptional regulator, copper-sensing transcriptional repressor